MQATLLLLATTIAPSSIAYPLRFRDVSLEVIAAQTQRLYPVTRGHIVASSRQEEDIKVSFGPSANRILAALEREVPRIHAADDGLRGWPTEAANCCAIASDDDGVLLC